MAKKDETLVEDENQGVTFEDGENYSWDMNDTEEDSGFAPLPKGTYLCTIDEVKFGLSKSSGNPTWYLTYNIAEGEFAEKNRKLFDIISLKPEQRGRVKQFLNRVAPELASASNFNPKKVAEEGLLVGKMLRAKIDVEISEEYGNRNRVKDRFAPSAGGKGSSGFSM